MVFILVFNSIRFCFDFEVGNYAGDRGNYIGITGNYAGAMGNYAGVVGNYAGVQNWIYKKNFVEMLKFVLFYIALCLQFLLM